jgi:hypothetical protein
MGWAGGAVDEGADAELLGGRRKCSCWNVSVLCGCGAFKPTIAHIIYARSRNHRNTTSACVPSSWKWQPPKAIRLLPLRGNVIHYTRTRNRFKIVPEGKMPHEAVFLPLMKMNSQSEGGCAVDDKVMSTQII